MNAPIDLAQHEALRSDLLKVVRRRGLVRFDEPRELSSGEMSRDFIDIKRALCAGRDLLLACRVIAESIDLLGVTYDAVGGLTLGADQFSHGVAAWLDDETEWFVVRKKAKGRGTNQLVEGAVLDADSRVLLVDDVVTTGGSIQQAHERVLETGASVVAAVTMVDRGDIAADYFGRREVPYAPVFTYRDLGIEPVGGSAHA